MQVNSADGTLGNATHQRKTASQIRRTGLVRMLGADTRLAANDEDREAFFLEADRAYAADKDSGALQARQDHRALEQQAHMLRCTWALL